jgi:alanine racemase
MRSSPSSSAMTRSFSVTIPTHRPPAAIEHNVGVVRAAAGGRPVCAVVKADGYGHGAVGAARAAQDAGASWLAVATALEARQLRDFGIEGVIVVLGALDREDARIALDARADVIAWTEELCDLPAPRVHVKLDTGMGRLGTRDADLATRLADRLAAEGRLAGLLTHFATADERGDAFFGEQLARFTDWVTPLRERHPGAVVHAANSAATFRDPAAHFDLVRPGVALYGLDPFGEDPAALGLRPALELRSRLGAVKPIAKGESAGYGRRFVAQRDTVVGTIPIGYGDGWRRGLTNNADVVVGGRRVPLVGTVSMDNVTVDLGPGAQDRPGDPVTLLGDGISAEEVARRLGTINYEVTCGLLPRVPREWA